MTAEVQPNQRGLFFHSFVQTSLAATPSRLSLPRDVHKERLLIGLRQTTDQLLAYAFWQRKPAATLLLVHGVGGSADAGYISRAIRQGLRAGFHVIALNLRGAGEGAKFATKFYHGGLISDLEDTVRFFSADPRVEQLVLLGFSLGGNATLKFAARGDKLLRRHIAAFATVSAPFDLLAGCRHIDSLPSFPYRRVIFQGLVRACANLPEDCLPLPVSAIKKLPSLQSFDDHVTAPMHSFADAEEYYRRASCGPDFSLIETPTLCVHAEDDPLIPPSTLEVARARAPTSMKFQWSPHGGHVGFVPSPLKWGQSWAVESALAFAREHLGRAATGSPAAPHSR